MNQQPPEHKGADAPGKPAAKGHPLIWLLAIVLIFGNIAVFAVLGLTGRPVPAPAWAVEKVEARINVLLDGQLSVSLGAAEVLVDRDWIPRVRLRDVTLRDAAGSAVGSVPELRVAFAPQPLLRGKIRPRSLRVFGGSLTLRRDESGAFNIAVGAGALAERPSASLAEVLDGIDDVFTLPVMTSLVRVETEGLTLTFDDARAGRVWRVSDGRARLANTTEDVSISVAFNLAGDAGDTASAELSFVSRKRNSAAQIGVTVTNVPAREVASQAPALTFLSVLDAPISGAFRADIGENGTVGTLDGTLGIGAGSVQPTPDARPLAIEEGKIYLSYEPAQEKINFAEITIQSPVLRLRGNGSAYLRDLKAGLPRTLLGQLRFSEVTIDPEGLFEEPARFSSGALDVRLRLDPFSLSVGQLMLAEEGRHLRARGEIGVEPATRPATTADEAVAAVMGTGGWSVALDVELDKIRHDRLLSLWPRGIVAKTRAWVSENVQTGVLSDVKAALRLRPGAEPRLSLGYEFSGADVRFLKTLPPIRHGRGFSAIEGLSYSSFIEAGFVEAPQGGRVNVAGSVFRVGNITQKPAQAEIDLRTDGSITATLSLLNEKPFEFLTKAGRPVDLAEGHARALAKISLPLQKKVPLEAVDYQVSGELTGVRSEKLVPGRVLTSRRLTVEADRSGLSIGGPGKLGLLPFDATWRQDFGPQHKGKSRVDGTVELSQVFLDEFAIGLPKGSVTGSGQGRIGITLEQGAAGRFALRSDLAGVGLSLPSLGWGKGRDARGKLELEGRLTAPPAIDRIALSAPGLDAEGSVEIRSDGSLEVARFDRVKLGGWLDAGAELRGQGKGNPVSVALTGGTLDMRKTRVGGGGGAGLPLTVALDRAIISDAISLTGMRGSFRTGGGLDGKFTAQVNGAAAVSGVVSPRDGRAAVRIKSEDAGAVFAAAGIFPNGRGGALDLVLLPRAEAGEYDGTLTIRDVRVRKAPVLAELLNVISVVGLLDQLQNNGLLFSNVEASFRLTPAAVELRQGAATGPSLGVSLAGLYLLASKQFDMQGVVSPIYLVNSVGSVISRQGEGLFGFTYRLRGTASAPKVSVNPLSIFTPGMFREIFRSSPPTLPE